MIILLSPEQYVHKNIIEYPSLYATSDDMNDAKNRIFDQLFNVIGNGITNHNKFLNDISVTEIPSKERAEYLLTAKLFTSMRIDGEFDYKYCFTVPEKEKINYPHVTEWIPCRKYKENNEIYRDFIGKGSDWEPYDNFEKEYSLVWKNNCEFAKKSPKEWIDAAINFYKTCKIHPKILFNVNESPKVFILETLDMLQNQGYNIEE